MEAIKTGIDPFLYRNYEYKNIMNLKDKYSRGKENSSEAEPSQNRSNFSDMIKDTIKKNEYNISSDRFSKTSSKKDILQEIKTDPEKKELYEASEQFEAYFMEKVFKEMKKNVPKNSLFHGGYAEEIFDEMLLTERIREMAHVQEFGLAEMIYDQMVVDKNK